MALAGSVSFTLEGHGLAPGSADAVERACPVLSATEQMIQNSGPIWRSWARPYRGAGAKMSDGLAYAISALALLFAFASIVAHAARWIGWI